MPTRCFAVLWWASSVVLYSTHPVQPFAFRSVHYAQQRRQHARHAIFALRSSRENRNSIMAGTANIGELSKAVLPFLPPESCRSDSPAESLRKGVWFKLICGASFEDLPAVRNLAVVYTLAGADCIDVAAEEAVIEAARGGVEAARAVAEAIGAPMRAPWLMMSVNDDEEDPHFRKAVFDPALCPSDCPRPCERVCPADAVVFPDSAPPPAQRADMVADLLAKSAGGGVLEPRCYGCGRCINVCPPGIIRADKYMRSPEVIRDLLTKVDAIEIHTKGNLERFRQTWEESVADAVAARSLKLVAVSFPDLGDDTGLAIAAMNAVMEMGPSVDRGGKAKSVDDGNLVGPASSRKHVQMVNGDRKMEGFVGDGVPRRGATVRAEGAGGLGEDMGRGGREGGGAIGVAPALNIWQTDGRPMSGDVGAGATAACVRLAEKVIATEVLPFGRGQHFVQLAGGTNDRTAPKLLERGWLAPGERRASAPAPAPAPAPSNLKIEGNGGVKPEIPAGGGSHRNPDVVDCGVDRKIGIGGVAYGGYARKIVGRVLDRIPSAEAGGDGRAVVSGDSIGKGGRVEEYPDILSAALQEAFLLIEGLKRQHHR